MSNAFSTDLEPQAQAAVVGGNATAIFAAADVIAIGAMRYAQANGLNVPDDISILGFDDIPLAEQALPALSTIELPVEHMAERAISLLVEQIALARPLSDPPTDRIATKLIVRASVATSGALR